MKSTKLLWCVILFLALCLGISLLSNLGIIDIRKHFKKSIISKNEVTVFHLTNMKMTLNNEWSLAKGIAVVKLDFTIENISKVPQIFYQDHLALFDYNDCRYDVSTTLNSKINPLLFSETINPNTKKELSVIFEVPQNELYYVCCRENIKRIGKQLFVDKIRNIECEYVTFKEMTEARKRLLNQLPKRTPSTQTMKFITPEIKSDKPAQSAYNSLTKEGTNPANEIEVDLNDFLGTPDDGTDWNYTELSEDCCQALASKGVYYSKNKGAWVMEVSRK